MDGLLVEPGGERVSGPCSCCGQPTKVVSGFVYRDGAAHAAYLVRWTPGRPQEGADFDLVVGPWGDGTGPADRAVVALRFDRGAAGPGFRVVDASGGKEAVAARALRRNEVIGTPSAADAFAVVDALCLNDPRLAELTAG